MRTHLGQQLGGDDAERAQQRPARVDQLDLAVARERLRVSRQAGGVPPSRTTTAAVSDQPSLGNAVT